MHTEHNTDVEDDQQAESRGSQLVRLLFERNDVPRRARSKIVEDVLAISYHAAHRRVIGKIPWDIEEIERLAKHYSMSLGDLLGEENTAGAHEGLFLVAGSRIPCRFWLDKRPGATSDLRARLDNGEWLVAAADAARDQEGFPVQSAHLKPAQVQGPRIAVLDDSQEVTDSLTSYLRSTGFDPYGFTSLEPLEHALAEGTRFGGYVLDWMIDATNVTRLVERIRQVDRACPIVVLTGKVRDGEVNETDIARVVAAHKAAYFEKPAPTAIIAAQLERAIESSRTPAD